MKVYNSAVLPRIRNQKTCQRVAQTSIQLTCQCGELSNDIGVVKKSETLIIWSTFW